MIKQLITAARWLSPESVSELRGHRLMIDKTVFDSDIFLIRATEDSSIQECLLLRIFEPARWSNQDLRFKLATVHARDQN